MDTLLILVAYIIAFAQRPEVFPFVPAVACGIVFFILGIVEEGFNVKLSSRFFGWVMWPLMLPAFAWAIVLIPINERVLNEYGLWAEAIGSGALASMLAFIVGYVTVIVLCVPVVFYLLLRALITEPELFFGARRR